MESLRYSTIKHSDIIKEEDEIVNKNYTFGKYFELVLLKQPHTLSEYPSLIGDFVVAQDGVRLPREHREQYNILREKEVKLAKQMASTEYAYFDDKLTNLNSIYDNVLEFQPEINGFIFDLPFSGTPDIRTNSMYFDIKTTSALNYKEIDQHFIKYDYDVQGYIYHSLTNKPIYFIFYLKNLRRPPYIKTFPSSTRELNRAKNKLINLIKINHPSYLLP